MHELNVPQSSANSDPAGSHLNGLERNGATAWVPQSPSIVDMLQELSSVQQELKAANRDLVDALSRSESADRIADFEQRVALLNELAESFAEKIATQAEAQRREAPPGGSEAHARSSIANR